MIGEDIAPWAVGYLARGFRYVPRPHPQHFDCWDFARLVIQEQFGAVLPEYLDSYGHSDEPAQTSAALTDHRREFVRRPSFRAKYSDAPPLNCSSRKPGDLVLLKFCGEPTHVGVYAGGDRLLHLRRPGVLLESLAPGQGALASRVEGYYVPCPQAL